VITQEKKKRQKTQDNHEIEEKTQDNNEIEIEIEKEGGVR